MYYFEAAIADTHTGKKVFTYNSNFKLAIGSIIKVPFGKKQVWAIVIATVKQTPTFKTKKVDDKPFIKLPLASVKLLIWMLDYYPEDNGLITKLFLPSKITGTVSDLAKIPMQIGQGNKLPKATNEQAKVLKKVKSTNNKRVLLHGDTGTGKTRVFIEIAKKILKNGQSVLILTPEIGLTPQLINDLKKYLACPIVLTHSALTNSKRLLAWYYTLNNAKPTIYVGPRSALFLPFINLGLIVIDEAHDDSYKQLQSPKYQSLNVAGQLANLHNCLLIHSTATPNIEEYEVAKARQFLILTMRKTAAGNQTSSTHVIDLKNREHFTKNPYLANELIDAINKALKKNEQIMLFLNRRGSARVIQCSQCAWKAMCPKCNLPLIYHHDTHVVRCHSCNYKDKSPSKCPKCGSLNIIYKVLGTKSLVEQVKKLFPKARIKRFDADSPTAEHYHKQIETIKQGDVDIIIGTQLITKGIDLPKLSVVGVINADTGLNLPDYRAEEVTFQQLYQVTGRAARGHIKSQLFIQTSAPDHPIMTAIKKRSWLDFYNYEFPKRRAFAYPPQTFLAILKITQKSSSLARTKSQVLFKQLNKYSNVKLLGPSPSFYEKTARGYTWQIILKAKKRSQLVEITKQLPSGWIANIDPSSLL